MTKLFMVFYVWKIPSVALPSVAVTTIFENHTKMSFYIGCNKSSDDLTTI